ncbi:unnamed protein product [Acanthosepion pharaonis]|uniref:Uncharacterized protein n=1 Tax=Acanthosepion pharaonis TaxID=158019 RepID=A0A812DX38_ACAPH|nr:unnamed protein product [Sepia pharaonis]
MELCTELYYQNITRILKFRQIEDELKETQIALIEAGKRNEAKLVKLTDHIKERSESLNKQKNKLRDIQIKVMIHSAGSSLTADKESNWEMLKKKISDVYISLLGRSKVRISTQQKLTNIENRLFELLQQLESAPSEKVEALWESILFPESLRHKYDDGDDDDRTTVIYACLLALPFSNVEMIYCYDLLFTCPFLTSLLSVSLIQRTPRIFVYIEVINLSVSFIQKSTLSDNHFSEF